MKKIVIAYAGTQFSESLFQFAQQLNERQPILLVGVFLPQVIYSDVYAYGSGLPMMDMVSLTGDEDREIVQKNMDRFAELCQHNGIVYRIHKDYNDLPATELKLETRFADLLLLSSEKFFAPFGLNDLNPSMHEALHTAECPVLVVPETFSFPQRNILSYDGSAASVFAIRQFAYLFPELSSNETLLVYANEETSTNLPDEVYIEEFAAQHFKNLNLLKLQVNPRTYFDTWLEDQGNAVLVGGSFGRSSFSELFKKSFLAKEISEHKLPVFIAHR